MVVDLPAPLGPNSPKTVPGLTEKLTLFTATRSPYVFCKSLISIKSYRLPFPLLKQSFGHLIVLVKPVCDPFASVLRHLHITQLLYEASPFFQSPLQFPVPLRAAHTTSANSATILL